MVSVSLCSNERTVSSVTRVLIAAFDGLQPSQVRVDLTPNLFKFADGGVTFARNHPVFPTVTRINVASLVTGRHPGSHGLAGNTVVMRDYDANNVIEAMEPVLTKVAEKTGDVLLVPTLADTLYDNGEEYVAVGVGTSGNAYVQNPRAEALGGATIHPEFCLPRGVHDQLIGGFGPWPTTTSPNVPQMEHGTRVLIEYVLAERSPTVALIWFSEPDSSNHKAGVGSVLSNQALASADQQFGRIIGWLEGSGTLEETDVIVVSDHGYATIESVVDIEAELRQAGFPSGGQPGGVLVASNGGALLFYAHEADPVTVERLATWLSKQSWCGAKLAAERVGVVPGTLPASVGNIDGRRSPDLTMSFAWSSAPNDAGFPGQTASSGGPVGVGTHGGMSRHELRNTLIARGPSFRRSTVVDTPTGNIDVAPTILHILGLPGGDDMDGRVLHEALDGGDDVSEAECRSVTHAAELGDYRQEVTVTTVRGSAYLDEGNAVLR
ncbi:MAG: sulfatase-like hydrolase/transferase [Chloroflexi bacterium]|nr:sulfatase-like hydrolase/transferase [Chloroflexota bacterium]